MTVEARSFPSTVTPSRGEGDGGTVIFRKATADDAEELLKLQYLCYQPEAALYGYGIQPLTQRLHEVVAEIAQGQAFVAVQSGFIVGGVRCHVDGEVMRLGKLICHPRVQKQGIGSRLMTLAEDYARSQPGVVAIVLFTGAESAHNLRFYKQRGYEETHTTSPPHLAWLRKRLR